MIKEAIAAAFVVIAAAPSAAPPPPPPPPIPWMGTAPPALAAKGRPTPYLIDGSVIQQVLCPDPVLRETRAGTGIRVSPTDVITASHIVHKHRCKVNGEWMTTVLDDRENDFAVLRGARRYFLVMPVNCDPIASDAAFLAAGFHDSDALRVTPAISTAAKGPDGAEWLTVFDGVADHGSSGGPMVDLNGYARGMILRYAYPGIRGGLVGPRFAALPLRATYLCRKG